MSLTRLKSSRSSISSATDDACSVETRTISLRSRSWNERWFQSPVSGSVWAWSSRLARACALSSASAAASPNRTASRNSSSVNSLETDAVDVQRSLDRSARDERDGDQRLGIGRRALDEPDARVEVGPVRKHGLAVRDRPAGDALAEAERLVGDHLLGVVPPGEDAPELGRGLVGLVDGEVVVGNELAERVGDPLEQCVERLLGEHLVKDVGEPAVRVEERECLSAYRASPPGMGSGRSVEEVTGVAIGSQVHRRGALCALRFPLHLPIGRKCGLRRRI